MHGLFVWAMEVLGSWGYLGIVILMALESTVFPLPSEFVIPPAAYWASQGRMSMTGVVLAGTFGSWLGSSAMYWLSAWLGRPLLRRWGRYMLVTEHKLEMAETWMETYGAPGVFFARLLPVARHLISIPAGLVRMNFGLFSALTTVGAAIWCSVLCWFGPRVITPEMLQDGALMRAALKSQMVYVLGLVVLLFVLYLLFLFMVRRRQKPVI